MSPQFSAAAARLDITTKTFPQMLRMSGSLERLRHTHVKVCVCVCLPQQLYLCNARLRLLTVSVSDDV